MKTYWWLFEVREKGTGKSLLPMEQIPFDTSDWYYAKSRYLSMIEYQPSKRKLLADKDWYIDAVLLTDL